MVRLQDDVDECGCLRCQNVEHEVLQRSLSGALLWSGKLPLLRPSILLVFLAVGAVQLTGSLVPASLALATAVIGVLGVFVGRGYIGVVGRERLGHSQPSSVAALGVVVRRLPAFLGAVLVILGVLVTVGLTLAFLLPPAAELLLDPIGVDAFTIELLVLVFTAASLVYLLVKWCFVPEACFVGGYGPLAAIRVSWRLTSVHRKKAVLIVFGFGALLALGIVLDTQLAAAGTPVALTVQVGETTVVLRSFGLSLAGGIRFVFDMLATAVYSGVFVHQYVYGIVSES